MIALSDRRTSLFAIPFFPVSHNTRFVSPILPRSLGYIFSPLSRPPPLKYIRDYSRLILSLALVVAVLPLGEFFVFFFLSFFFLKDKNYSRESLCPPPKMLLPDSTTWPRQRSTLVSYLIAESPYKEVKAPTPTPSNLVNSDDAKASPGDTRDSHGKPGDHPAERCEEQQTIPL